MLGEICFLFAGAVGGVAADRLWRKVENRVKLDIVACQLVAPDGLGIKLKITNRGSVPVPAFQISVRQPSRGSVFLFTNNATDALLPRQTVEEDFLLTPAHVGPSSEEFFFRCVDGQADDFWLTIKQRQGEALLFESLKAGNAFARIYRQMYKDRSFANVSSKDWQELFVAPVPWYRAPFARRSPRQKAGQVISFSIPLSGPPGEMKCRIIKPK